MGSIEDACETLLDALRAVPGLNVESDMFAAITPPAAILGPPTLFWEAYCEDPTAARFRVIVAEGRDPQTMPRLWALVPTVVAALENVTDAAVETATPLVWTAAEIDYPAYDITVEVSLR